MMLLGLVLTVMQSTARQVTVVTSSEAQPSCSIQELPRFLRVGSLGLLVHRAETRMQSSLDRTNIHNRQVTSARKHEPGSRKYCLSIRPIV